MIKRLVCVVTLLGLMTGLAGCFLTRISASRPLIGDELAQVRTGLSLSEVRDLFGEPYRTGSWQEYVDEARTETVLYEDWNLILQGIDTWEVEFDACNGVVWYWRLTPVHDSNLRQRSGSPYILGYSGKRPEVVYPLRQLYIGMPREEVEAAFGPPDTIKFTSTLVGSLEQTWEYMFQQWPLSLFFDDEGLLADWFANGVDHSLYVSTD